VSIVLAVLETTVSAGPVLDTAVRIAELTGSEVEAAYVPGSATFEKKATSLARRARVPLRRLEEPESGGLVAVVADPEVLAAVIGARSQPAGRHPVGPLARKLLERTEKPVVVVRPDINVPPVLQRVLIPLEGTELSSRPVLEHLSAFLPDGVELVVLHVFTDDTLPAMLDRPDSRSRDPRKGVPPPSPPACAAHRIATRLGRQQRRRGLGPAGKRSRRAQLVSGRVARASQGDPGGPRVQPDPRPAAPDRPARHKRRRSRRNQRRSGRSWLKQRE
jgi:nucleotide-binding universal stress UspA family protein